AEIGYIPRNPATAKCERQIKADGICWVSTDLWSVQLGNATAGAGTVSFPNSAVNLTRRLNGRVPNGHAGQKPPGVRSRVTLHGGSAADTCAMGLWNFVKSANEPGKLETLPLINMLTWSIPAAGRDRLVLERKHLHTARTEVIATLVPDASDTIELFIQHVPRSEARRAPVEIPLQQLLGTGQGVTRSRSTRALAGQPADHFRAYNRLLGVPNAETPRFIRYIRSQPCAWRIVGNKAFIRRPGLGTLNCMVASADVQ
ncbi:MAG TPA: hypothetical protein VF263_14635, partial [Longimicrobiaceae bacterium]